MTGARTGRSPLLACVFAASLYCGFGAAALAQSPVSEDALPAGPGSLSGLWNTLAYKGSRNNPPRTRVVRTVEGEWPPLRPEAAALLEERIRMSEAGTPFVNAMMQCLPGGVPQFMFGTPYPMQILETPGQVTILFEMYNHFRVIYLDSSHPEDPDPGFMGHSVGHWEGDTLVVDTIGLTDKTTIDEVGMPHSENLHITERFRRVDRDTLEIVTTIDDPAVFTRAWDASSIYKAAPPGMEMLEFICENNRGARE